MSEGEDYAFSGENLILTLAKFKDPDVGNESDSRNFKLIEEFTKKLLHLNDSTTLSITRENPQLVIESEGLRLPLSSYGTGVHQIVILLTAIFSKPNSIICIEEPETNLHPQLQREFIKFIIDNTDNTFIITTHSSALINLKAQSSKSLAESVSTFYMSSSSGESFGGAIINDTQTLAALSDIGVKASDILQANCLIWVEGPSDRIYIRHWISMVDSELKEGIHYHFNYYGGRILAGFNVARDSEDVDDFINILKINQRSIVVIDSDRKIKSGRINATKTRIQKECLNIGVICWITYGREIENYLSDSSIYRTFLSNTPEFKLDRFDKIEEIFLIYNKNNKSELPQYNSRKTTYAEKIVRNGDLSDFRYDLRENINTIVRFISDCNS